MLPGSSTTCYLGPLPHVTWVLYHMLPGPSTTCYLGPLPHVTWAHYHMLPTRTSTIKSVIQMLLHAPTSTHNEARSSHRTYPLTLRVVGAPQMILQPTSSIFSLVSTALWDLAYSRPVHSLMSSHRFSCRPCFLPTFDLPCKMVLTRPDEQET